MATNLAAAATALSAAAVLASAAKKTPEPEAKTAPVVEPAPKKKTEPVRIDRTTTTTTTTTTAPRRGSHGLIWLIILVVLVAAGIFLWLHFRATSAAKGTAGGGAHAGKNQQARVVTAVATRTDIPIYVIGLGAVTPLNTVTVQSRVNGQLMKVYFTEGQMVKAGDVLEQIDDRPFVATVEQLQAQKEHDEALLENAMIDLNRYQELWKQDSIPQQTLATQESLVKQDQGTVDSDQAQIVAAQLNVTYSRIISPIDGRVGLRLVDVGNYVQSTASSGLVVITQIQPITVIFTIPEDSIAAVVSAMKLDPQLPVDAYTRGGFTQELANGNLLTIDNQIDPTTGTVKLRASFPNIDNALFPNQFVNARMLVDTKKNVVTVPVAAVQHGTNNSTFIYTLDAQDSTVHLQNVTTGAISFDGSTEEITKGINENDTVVTDGVDKLSDGAKVVVAKPDEANGSGADSTSPPDSSSSAPDTDAGPATSGGNAEHHHKKKPASGDTNAAPAP
jgi:multidrug efflux system membrane fusion protein